MAPDYVSCRRSSGISGCDSQALPAGAREVAACGPRPDVPLVVISAGMQAPECLREHAAMARLSHTGKHVVAQGSGHWIQLDDPEVVVSAIRHVVEAVRAGPTARHSDSSHPASFTD